MMQVLNYMDRSIFMAACRAACPMVLQQLPHTAFFFPFGSTKDVYKYGSMIFLTTFPTNSSRQNNIFVTMLKKRTVIDMDREVIEEI
jgi:hypothetical protein